MNIPMDYDKNFILAENPPKSDNEKRYLEESKHLATFAQHRHYSYLAYLFKKEPIEFLNDDDMFIFSGKLSMTVPKLKQACIDQATHSPNLKILSWNQWSKQRPQFEPTRY